MGNDEQDPDRGPHSEVLELRFEPEFLRLIGEKAERLGTDVSWFVRWCIRTGLILGDLNEFVRSRIGKES